MADDFTLDVTVKADLAPFNADLRAAFAEAAKGVTVPIRGGTGFSRPDQSQASPAPVRVSAADEARVAEVRNRVLNESRPGYAGGWQGGQGGTFSPRVNTGEASIGINRIRGQYEELLRFIAANPIRFTSDTTGVSGAIGRARDARGRFVAGGRSLSGSDALTAPLIRPGDVSDGGPVTARTPRGGTVSDAFMESTVGGSPPPFPPDDPDAVADRVRRGAGRYGRGRFGGQVGNTRSFRGLLGLFGVSEVARSIEAGSFSRFQAGLATNPTDAAQAIQEGINQQTSGLLGSAAGLILDQSGNGPTAARQNILVAAAQSQALDRARDAFATARSNEAIRTAVGVGRPVAEIQARRDAEVRRLQNERSNLTATAPQLSDFASGAQPGQTSQGGAVRASEYARFQAAQSARNAQLRANQIEQDEARRQATADIARAETDQALSNSQVRRQTGLLNLQASGASDRALARVRIANDYGYRVAQAFAQGGAPAARLALAEGAAASSAQELGFTRDDARLRFGTQQANFAANNQPLQAQLSAAVFAASQLRQQGYSQTDISQNLAANIAATVAPFARNFQAGQIQSQGTGAQLTALLNRNPLGAALAGINTQQQLANQGAESLPFGFRQLAQFGINANAGLQRQLARRDDADRRFEIGAGIDESIRQSRFRQGGTEQDRIASTLDRIVSSGQAEARQLERQGYGAKTKPTQAQIDAATKELEEASAEYSKTFPDDQVAARLKNAQARYKNVIEQRDAPDSSLAGRRRQLAVEQVREAQKDYFRSIQFDEVSGDRIAAGRGNPFAGIGQQFKDAETKAREASDKGAKDGPTGTQIQSIIDLITSIITNGFPSRAG